MGLEITTKIVAEWMKQMLMKVNANEIQISSLVSL